MHFHKNSHLNPEPHHLYVIYDGFTKQVFKYGISCEAIGADGLSSRLRDQLADMNAVVDWSRFQGEILVQNIAGRLEAERVETRRILDYERRFGKKPRGNKKTART